MTHAMMQPLPKTGATCRKDGMYRGDCGCWRDIALRRGDLYPQCPSCERDVIWNLLREFQSKPPDQEAKVS